MRCKRDGGDLKVLVTGANGFVGRYLIHFLAKSTTDDIVAVGGPTIPSVFPKNEFIKFNRAITWDSVDLLQEDAVRDLIYRHQPDQVYHLAALAVTHGIPARDYLEINVIGTYTLAKALVEVRGSSTKLLFVSSASVYGHSDDNQCLTEEQILRPRNAYGASKACAEDLLWVLSNEGLSLTIARPFNHTGPGQRPGFVVPDLLQQVFMQKDRIKGNQQITLQVGPLDSVRDFTDVRDVVRAYYTIMNSGSSGHIYNVASGWTYSIHDVVDIVCQATKAKHVEIVSNDDYVKKRDTDVLMANSVKLQQLDWHPNYSLEQTVIDMWEYLVSR